MLASCRLLFIGFYDGVRLFFIHEGGGQNASNVLFVCSFLDAARVSKRVTHPSRKSLNRTRSHRDNQLDDEISVHNFLHAVIVIIMCISETRCN